MTMPSCGVRGGAIRMLEVLTPSNGIVADDLDILERALGQAIAP